MFNYGAAMLSANQPIMKTLRPYAHKAFYGRKTREWVTHFHNFYWPSFVKVKLVETTTGSNSQPLGGNGGNNFRVGPLHNGGNGGNNFSVGKHNPMVEMMEMMELTSVLASNTIIVEMVEIE